MYEKLLGDVKGIYNRLTFIDIINSILWVIIGIILTSNSDLSNQIVSIVLGVLFIINGIFSIYSFIKRGSITLYNLNIIYGIIMLIIGVLAIVFQNILQILIGIFFIFLGIQKLTYGLLLKKFSEQSWLLTLVVGILYITMGIISFFSSNIIAICGILIIGYGLINIVNTILLRRRSKYYIA